jgi:hypothetical protein
MRSPPGDILILIQAPETHERDYSYYTLIIYLRIKYQGEN